MEAEEIKNYLRISDGLASSGQPEGRAFRHIAAAGYQVVVNLAMPNSENAIPEEGYMVSALGMTYIHIPVPFERPEPGHLWQFTGVMEVFRESRIWVHCALNYRASAFLYQYLRLACGADPDQARRAMLPGWEPDGVWQAFLKLERDALAP